MTPSAWSVLPRTAACVVASAMLVAAGPAGAEFNCNAGVEFHPGGGPLAACTLNGVHVLHTAAGLTVHCADGARAAQYPDGRLRACTLERVLETGAQVCAQRSRAEFDDVGRLRACRPR